MLANFIEKILSLAENKEHKINGETYTDKPVIRVESVEYHSKNITLHSLEALVNFLKVEAKEMPAQPIFVEVASEKEVQVFTTYDEKFHRDYMYTVTAEPIRNTIGCYTDKDELITQLNSVYVYTEDIDYMLELLNSVSEESKVSSTDNGLGQKVEATRGIAMKTNLQIKPRITLAPYRTFMEVVQPESEFILRMQEGAQFLIKEADGGCWKLEAKSNIKNWLKNQLEQEILLGKVIVTA